MFTGIADDILKPLVLNKFDKKTQRQLAEIWSYGWILHGVIFCRTQLRKHHKVLYNRGNELQKFLVSFLSNCAFFNKIFLFRSIHYLYKCSSVLQECHTVFNCRQHRIRLNPVLSDSIPQFLCKVAGSGALSSTIWGHNVINNVEYEDRRLRVMVIA